MNRSKIAVSVPTQLVSKVRRAVAKGRATSVSAYVTQAIEARTQNDEMLELLEQMDRERGKPDAEATRWARQVLGL
jgi:antitoxin ParD1/3/4